MKSLRANKLQEITEEHFCLFFLKISMSGEGDYGGRNYGGDDMMQVSNGYGGNYVINRVGCIWKVLHLYNLL